MLRHRVLVAGCVVLVAVALITSYLWQRHGAGQVVARLQSPPVGDLGVSFVTWGEEVVLIVWRDFALT